MLFREKSSDICAIAAGDNGAFCRIYIKYKDEMYRYSYSILKDHQDAEDIVHDALLRILQKAHTYVDGNEKAWVMRIVHNLSINLAKKRSRELTVEEVHLTLPKKENKFYDMMDLIPDTVDRQIVVLKIDLGYRTKDIAKLLCLTPNVVSKRYRKTLKHLRQNFKFN